MGWVVGYVIGVFLVDLFLIIGLLLLFGDVYFENLEGFGFGLLINVNGLIVDGFMVYLLLIDLILC